MTLYHFTRPECVASIMRDGLRAGEGRENDNGWMANYRRAVWLTERASLVPTLASRRKLLRRGILCGPRGSNLPDATVCLAVHVEATDHNLVHLRRWLRKNRWPGSPDPSDPAVDSDYWFYESDIAPDRLSVFKRVERGVPFYEIPAAREAWLAGARVTYEPGLEDEMLAGRAGPADYVEAHRSIEPK